MSREISKFASGRLSRIYERAQAAILQVSLRSIGLLLCASLPLASGFLRLLFALPKHDLVHIVLGDLSLRASPTNDVRGQLIEQTFRNLGFRGIQIRLLAGVRGQIVKLSDRRIGGNFVFSGRRPATRTASENEFPVSRAVGKVAAERMVNHARSF